ncbi:MAG: MBL fold metallo-hydrolase [Armatimonadetes bacterium]|nr:MBL fold metallo-hydrolase [Armatimonadota bacterium]
MKQKNNVAFWEDSFRDELEGMSIQDGVLLWALSGPTFAIRTPRAMLYLDPYFGGDPVECAPYAYRATQIPLDPSRIRLADAVLISHDHYDHCHEQTLQPMARNTGAPFYGPASAVREMVSYNLPGNRIHGVKPGDRFEVEDVAVTVWPAYDEYEPQAVTYMIESGGVRIFFGGDTSEGPAFDEIGTKGGVDIALVAFGRKWYMGEAQMLDAAERLRPKLLLPFHWELWRAYTGDILEFGRLVERRKPDYDVRILLVGDYLHYRPDGQFTKGR